MSTTTVERLSLHTRDVDAARSRVGELFCPHRLEPRGRAGVALSLDVSHVGGLAFVDLDYGHAVEIRPEPLSTFYLVQIPLAGTARIAQGSVEIVSAPPLASVLSPVEPASMTWHADNPQLIVYVGRPVIEQELGRLLGRPVGTPVVFELGMQMATADAQGWLRAVRFLREEARREGSVLDRPACADALTSTLVTHLLETQPHTYSEALRHTRSAAPGAARRAVDFIESHLGEPLSVSSVADAVGVGTRALQEAFRRELDTTPLAFIRERRLARAREALLRAAPTSTSVTEVAVGLGVTHLGRFSVEYHQRYGETPSTTLRGS